MPGFLGAIGIKGDKGFSKEERQKLVIESKKGKDWILEQRTINKFLLDKPFYEDDNFIVLVEGVVFNRRAIEAKYKSSTFTGAIIASYAQNGETFFKEFRGSFSGLLYDKRKETWLIYTDHIGDKQVFYSDIPEGVAFGSEMGFVVDYLKNNQLKISMNPTGEYLVITYGFLIENHTLVKEIKKLHAGYYLRVHNNKAEEIRYHEFKNTPNKSITEAQAIEEIDKLFKNAVRLQFEKDKEYGYKHITTLSGGLDTRMTVWVAHELGYTTQLNTTFSQSNYLDETISKQISTDLHHDYIFKALDHGNFITDIDNIAKITYGGGSFFGLAHGKSLYDLIDFDSFGLVHTGQIGDAIIGSFFKRPEYTEVAFGQGAYSYEVIDRLKDYKFHYSYPNEEIFCLYSRAFTGANQGLLVFQEKTESYSPFYDVDFLEFCYSLPVLMRLNHKIYFDWILQKHAGAAEYIWEKKKAKIKPVVNKPMTYITISGHKIPKSRFRSWFVGFALRRLGLRKKGEKVKIYDIQSKFNMNPLEYWYNTNESLRAFMDNYFKQHIHLIEDPKLKEDCTYLYEQCDTLNKTQVLTLLSALRLIV